MADGGAQSPAADVAAEMHRLTLRIVAQALFGTELRDEVAAISRAV